MRRGGNKSPVVNFAAIDGLLLQLKIELVERCRSIFDDYVVSLFLDPSLRILILEDGSDFVSPAFKPFKPKIQCNLGIGLIQRPEIHRIVRRSDIGRQRPLGCYHFQVHPGLGDKLGNLPSQLSGGQQQRVAIARAIASNPKVLLLDEPTRGIDVGAKYEIYKLIIELAKEGKAVIMVSSEMPELLGVADRIMVMSNGRIAGFVTADSTTQEEILQLAAKYV